MQEHRWAASQDGLHDVPAPDSQAARGWSVLTAGIQGGQHHGVGLLMAPHWSDALTQHAVHMAGRILEARFACTAGQQLAVFSVYAPHEKRPAAEQHALPALQR